MIKRRKDVSGTKAHLGLDCGCGIIFCAGTDGAKSKLEKTFTWKCSVLFLPEKIVGNTGAHTVSHGNCPKSKVRRTAAWISKSSRLTPL